MADDPNLLGPQPSLVRLAQGLRIAADEAEKLQNSPAFRDGEAIVAAIQDLSQKFHNQFQTQNQKIQNLTNETRSFRQELRTQLKASELNNVARIQNSYASTPESPLMPLVNISTAAQVPNFPAMSKDIARMGGPELDAILRDLGVEPTTESVASKRRQLRGLIGLATRPETA
ncbi:hypothetical protein AYL99_11447 [Fonsecaea erecta]|uniref:Uncharacterized protein n=1 Tax=Fonsecaea erecta TaxID=1367422 RepID=A0A178Z4C8_9EURO|nr:hypothetical protein AYL99_11447 [Fonsecaea erecta]OAP54346.1 hypothetical protein AYL99_11447 [Fonsecaea erecta]